MAIAVLRYTSTCLHFDWVLSTYPYFLSSQIQSKIQLYANRYHLVHQRLRRNPLFRSVHWAGVPGQAGAECEVRVVLPQRCCIGLIIRKRGHTVISLRMMQLTELKALLGQVGQPRCVLGFLSQPQEGQHTIEDLSARLPIDLQDTARTPGLFTGDLDSEHSLRNCGLATDETTRWLLTFFFLCVPENAIVVAEGSLQTDGTFKATALGMPPPETRAASVEALQGLDTFGGSRLDEKTCSEWEALHPEDSLVLMSDVWLDDDAVMARLEAQFEEYASSSSELAPPPRLIVLAGNFLSPSAYKRSIIGGGGPWSNGSGGGRLIGELQRAFGSLTRLLARFPKIAVRVTS